MQFKSQIVVLGAKASKGEFNGRPFDSTTVYYQADLQDGENFAGQVGAEIKSSKPSGRWQTTLFNVLNQVTTSKPSGRWQTRS